MTVDGKQPLAQMSDIAREAGVSIATVSRALNGSPLVNEQTRARVRALADKLNYSIHSGAQSLRRGSSRTLSLLIPRIAGDTQPVTDPFLLGLLGQVADVVTSRGFDLLVTRVDEERLAEADGIVRSRRADGLIVVGQGHDDSALQAIARGGVPLGVWGTADATRGYFAVGSDNLLGGRLAAERLLARGCKRVAFFGDVSLPEPAQRYAGYCQALQSAGKSVIPAVQIPFEESAARQALEDAIRDDFAFDGVFASSDLIAIAAVGRLTSLGKNVPADVAVIGYDDLPIATRVHPQLTTVRQPLHEAATALVDGVLAQQQGQSVRAVTLATELVLRESA